VDELRQQRCKVCWRADRFDFHVPDNVWAAVVPEALRDRVICLSCFDALAEEQGVDYAEHVHVLFFAGRRTSLEFRRV
jgi:hypothetical protein